MGNPSEHMDSTLNEIGALRGFSAERPPVPSSLNRTIQGRMRKTFPGDVCNSLGKR